MSEEEKEITPLLKVKEVARACGVSVGAVYNAIQSGRLKAAHLGSKKGLRITPEEIRKWIQSTQHIQHISEEKNLIV